MTKQDLISKYKPYPTYTEISMEGYNAGLEAGRNENKSEAFKRLESEVKELRLYKKEMEKTLHNPERLSELIAGL